MTESEENEGSKGPSKFSTGLLAWGTYSDLKKLMEGNPVGAVGLIGDAGKWAQLLIPEAIATPVIAGGLYVLTGISLSMGEGSPESGDAFSNGAELFQSNGKSLEGAYPTETWTGTASDAYMSQNSHQIQRATTMLEADNDIARILSTQAQQVHDARTEVDWASKGLAAMIPVAMALEATVLGAPESIALQIAAVAVAAAAAGMAAGNLVSYAQQNAAQLHEAADKYRQAGTASPSECPTASPPDSGNRTGPNAPGQPDGPANPDSPSGTTPGTVGPGIGSTGGSGGGSGAGSGGGSGGSPAAPSMPQMPGAPGTPSGAGSTPSAGSGAGGAPSAPQTGGGSGSGGSGSGGGGLLGSLLGAAAQIAQAATQAAQQAEQQDPNAQNDDEPGDGQPDADPAGDPDAQHTADPQHSGAAAGAELPAGRAPIHVSFDAGAAHTELTVDPETTRGSIHVSLDPANPTAPPHITTDA
jgi:hypothetical protein